jgi:hypothetical protein
MGTPVKILFFPFISEPFHQTARQNPPSHGQSWDYPSCPWNSTEKGGLTFGVATLYYCIKTVGFQLKYGKFDLKEWSIKKKSKSFIYRRVLFYFIFSKKNKIYKKR